MYVLVNGCVCLGLCVHVDSALCVSRSVYVLTVHFVCLGLCVRVDSTLCVSRSVYMC